MHQQSQRYGIQSKSATDYNLTATYNEDEARGSSSSSSSSQRHEQNVATSTDIDTLARTVALHIPNMNTFSTMAPWPPFPSTIPLSASDSATATASAAAAAMPLSFEEISLASSPPVIHSAVYNDRNLASSVHGLIQEPHENDVLCGRGGSINSHPGNRKFRDWIIQRKESYMLARCKADKTRVTYDVLHLVQNQTPPGRFLQKFTMDDHHHYQDSRGAGRGGGRSKSGNIHLGSGWWVEIDEMKALAKCSQALREGAPAFRALHKTEKKVRNKKRSTSEGGSRLRTARNKRLLQQQAQQETTTKEKPKQQPLPPPPPLVSMAEMRKESPSMQLGVTPTVSSSTQYVTQAASFASTTFPPPAFPPTSEIDETECELNALYPVSSSIFETDSNDNVKSISSFPLLNLGDYTASMTDVAKAIPTPTMTESKPRISTPSIADKRPSGEWFPGSLLYSPFTPFVSPGMTPHAEGTRAATSGGGWWDAISFLPNLSPMPQGHGNNNEEQSMKRAHSLSSFSEGDFYSDDSFKNPFENDIGNNDRKQEPLFKSTSMPQGRSGGDPNHGMMYAEMESRTFLPMLPHGHSTERSGLYGGHNSVHHHSVWHKATSRASSVSSLSQRSISNLNNHSKRKSIS